jgi:hypothetical protein
MRRIRTLAINLGIIALAIASVLVGLEVGLAFLKINTKSNGLYIDKKGTTYLPGAYYRHTKEGYSEGYINSHGFRDRERSYQKPANTYRILVLGDSQVEALQVSLENSFPALLEKALNEQSNSMTFEVLAVGQSGFGTADEYMRYLNFGVNYSPDVVVLVVTTANDIQDNSKFLSWDSPRFYFLFGKNRDLILDQSTLDAYGASLTLPKRLLQSLKRHSYLANMISERLFLLRNQLHKADFETRASDAGAVELNRKVNEFSELNIYVSDMTPRWREAFEITEKLFSKFKASVQEHGAKFVLVTTCSAEQVHLERAELLNKQYGLIFDYEQPNRIFEEFSRRESITLLQLLPTFREYHLLTGIYLHGFGSSMQGHWNEHGHRLAAKEMYRFLVEKHLVPLK